MRRIPTPEEYCHEHLGDSFAEAISTYDTSRRVEILVDEFLSDDMLRGKRVLDVGCGLGFFSERLAERGADVVACDIGESLVTRTRQRAGCVAVVADALELVPQFGAASFDGVVSSECIEHVPQPAAAVRQMMQVLKPDGFLSVSTPNIVWGPIIKLATVMHMRPFDGHENLSSWRSLRTTIRRHGGMIQREYGLHLFPFQIPLRRLSRICDRRLQALRSLMINICILATKQPNQDRE